jgi:hypothetical protein
LVATDVADLTDSTAAGDVDPDGGPAADTGSTGEELPDTVFDIDLDVLDVAEDTGSGGDLDAESDTIRDADSAPDTGPDASDSDARSDAELDASEASRGECSSAEDCGGSPCLHLHDESGGYTTCWTRPDALVECLGDEASPACCSAADCPDRTECFAGPLFYCGGPEPIRTNTCHPAQCVEDADCADRSGGLCVPEGAFREPAARCIYAGCRVDADCTVSDRGQCSPFWDACTRRFATFSCTYEDSPCRSNRDCGLAVCVPVSDHATACVRFEPPP